MENRLEEAGTVFDFVGGVGDFVPDDRGEIVKADATAVLLDLGMEWDHGVATGVLPARKANVADNTDQPSTGNQRAETVRPDLIKLVEKLVVVLDMPKWPVAVAVHLQRPVRRGGQDKLNAVGLQCRKISGIAKPELVACRHLLDGAFNQAD